MQVAPVEVLLQWLFSIKNSLGVWSPQCHNNLTQHVIKVTYGFLPCLEKGRDGVFQLLLLYDI